MNNVEEFENDTKDVIESFDYTFKNGNLTEVFTQVGDLGLEVFSKAGDIAPVIKRVFLY